MAPRRSTSDGSLEIVDFNDLNNESTAPTTFPSSSSSPQISPLDDGWSKVDVATTNATGNQHRTSANITPPEDREDYEIVPQSNRRFSHNSGSSSLVDLAATNTATESDGASANFENADEAEEYDVVSESSGPPSESSSVVDLGSTDISTESHRNSANTALTEAHEDHEIIPLLSRQSSTSSGRSSGLGWHFVDRGVPKEERHQYFIEDHEAHPKNNAAQPPVPHQNDESRLEKDRSRQDSAQTGDLVPPPVFAPNSKQAGPRSSILNTLEEQTQEDKTSPDPQPQPRQETEFEAFARWMEEKKQAAIAKLWKQAEGPKRARKLPFDAKSESVLDQTLLEQREAKLNPVPDQDENSDPQTNIFLWLLDQQREDTIQEQNSAQTPTTTQLPKLSADEAALFSHRGRHAQYTRPQYGYKEHIHGLNQRNSEFPYKDLTFIHRDVDVNNHRYMPSYKRRALSSKGEFLFEIGKLPTWDRKDALLESEKFTRTVRRQRDGDGKRMTEDRWYSSMMIDDLLGDLPGKRSDSVAEF